MRLIVSMQISCIYWSKRFPVACMFFTAWLKDKADAWKRYLALVNCAGTVAYPGLVAAAGFDSPFADGTMRRIAQTVGDWIEQQDERLAR